MVDIVEHLKAYAFFALFEQVVGARVYFAVLLGRHARARRKHLQHMRGIHKARQLGQLVQRHVGVHQKVHHLYNAHLIHKVAEGEARHVHHIFADRRLAHVKQAGKLAQGLLLVQMRIDVFENGAALVQLDGIALFVAALALARKAGEVDEQLHQLVCHIHVRKLALFGHIQNGLNARLAFYLV